MNLSRLAVASQFSQSNKARSGRSEKAGKRRHGARRRWRDLAQAVQQRRLGARDGVGDGRGEARDRRLAEEVVPRTSSRKSEGVEEARSRLAGAGYSGSGSNPVPASSSCSGSASSRSRAAADGASCASAAARFEVMGTFAGFRDLRSFLLGTHHIHYIVESQRDLSWRTALRGHVAINTCGRGVVECRNSVSLHGIQVLQVYNTESQDICRFYRPSTRRCTRCLRHRRKT